MNTNNNTTTGAPQEDASVDVQSLARIAVARALKEARIAKGLTIREVGELAGIGFSHVMRIENGSHNFTINSVAVIARVLGVKSIPLY